MKKVIEYPTNEKVFIDTTSEEFKELFKRIRNNYDLFGPIADYIDIDLYQLFVSKSKNSRFEIIKKSYTMGREGNFDECIDNNSAIISNDHIERKKTDRNMNWDIDIYLDNNLFSYDIMTNIYSTTENTTYNKAFTQEAEHELSEGEYIVAIIYRKIEMLPLILILSGNYDSFHMSYYLDGILCYLENYDSSKVEFSNYGLPVKFATEITTRSPIQDVTPLSIRDKTKSLVYTLDEKPIELSDGTLRLLKIYEDEENGPVSIYQFIDLNGDVSHGFYFNSKIHPFSYVNIEPIHDESIISMMEDIINQDKFKSNCPDISIYNYTKKEYFSHENGDLLEAHYSREREDGKIYHLLTILLYKVGDNIFYHVKSEEHGDIYIGYGDSDGEYRNLTHIIMDNKFIINSNSNIKVNIIGNTLTYSKSGELECMLYYDGKVIMIESSLYNAHDFKLRDQYGIPSDFDVFLKATGLTFE